MTEEEPSPSSYSHFLRHMAMEDEDDLRDLGIKADRELPLASFFKRRDEARRRFNLEQEGDRNR